MSNQGVLGLDDPVEEALAAPFLRPASFPRGALLFGQGAESAECFVIDDGEVRIEVERPDFDSDGVLSFVRAGELCGELGFLDGAPRSASAYAHTAVEARRLSTVGLRDLCREHPPVGVRILEWLARGAAERARRFSKRVEEFAFDDQIDSSVDEVVLAATIAQRELATWSNERVDGLIDAVADAVCGAAADLAAATVAETGMGNVADKTLKNAFASDTVRNHLRGAPGLGPRPPDAYGVVEVASPVGVVLGLIPVTNPVSTLVFKTLICLKSGNALVASGHLGARTVVARTVELIRSSLEDHGAPPDLVQLTGEPASRARTGMFMRHPGVALILATGGSAMVRAAYSSGTPAIGVGSGNAPAWVSADADVVAAAEAIVASKSFDHGIICGSENNIVVEASVRDGLVDAMERAGAAVLTSAEADRLLAAAFDHDQGLRRELVGQSAAAVAERSGIRRDVPPRLLVVPLGHEGLDGPCAREKLAPIVSLFTVDGDDEALSVCGRLLTAHGTGHTAIVHTTSAERWEGFALAVPVSRILVNGPGSQGCIGLGNGLTPSLTLGCGTFGGTSTTDNVSYTNLLNIKRIATPSPGPDRGAMSLGQ